MHETLTGAEDSPHRPNIHELRVAVFSISQRALIGSFSSPDLFIHTQPLNENGMVGVSHETRAVTFFNCEAVKWGIPHLKMLGRLGEAIVTDEQEEPHKVSAVAVTTAEPYDFRLFRLRRYDIDDLSSYTTKELTQPGSTAIDTLDARFIYQALKNFPRYEAMVK